MPNSGGELWFTSNKAIALDSIIYPQKLVDYFVNLSISLSSIRILRAKDYYSRPIGSTWKRRPSYLIKEVENWWKENKEVLYFKSEANYISIVVFKNKKNIDP